MKNWDRLLDIITCGRPLFYSTYVQLNESMMSGLQNLKGVPLDSAPKHINDGFEEASS